MKCCEIRFFVILFLHTFGKLFQVQLHKANEAREKGERRLKQLEEEAKRKDEEILEIKSKVYLRDFPLKKTNTFKNN